MPKNLELGINLSTKGVDHGIKDLEGKFKGLQSHLNKFSSGNLSSIGDAFRSIAGSLGPVGAGLVSVGAAAAIAGREINRMVLEGSKIADLAPSIGVTAEEYQKLGFMASQSGTSMETLSKSMLMLGRNAYEASTGSKSAQAAFDALGVSIRNSNGELKTKEELLRETFISLSKVKNSTEQTAIAQQLLGKSAADLAPIYTNSTAKIEQYFNTMKDGVVYTNAMVENADRAGDSFAILGKNIEQLRNEQLAPLLTTLANVSTWLVKVREQNKETTWGMDPERQEKYNSSISRLQTGFGKTNEELIKMGFSTMEIISINQMYEAELKKSNYQSYLHSESISDIDKNWKSGLRSLQNYGTEFSVVKKEAETWSMFPGTTGTSGSGEQTTEAIEAAAKAKAAADAARIKAQADYNALLEKGRGIAEASREAILSETLGGRVALIEEETQKRIDAINLPKNADIDKEEAIRLLRLDTEKRIKEERNKQAQEDLATHLELQRKREESQNRIYDLQRSKFDVVSKLEEARKLKYSRDLMRGKLGWDTLSNPSDDLFSGITLPKQVLNEIELASNALADQKNYANSIKELEDINKSLREGNEASSLMEINLNNQRIDQYEELIRLSKGFVGNSSGFSQQLTIEAAKRSTTNPTWMSLRDANGDKITGQPSYGEKLAEQWDATSFGDRAQLITEQATQMYSTINDAAQMAFEATIAREQAEIDMAKKKEYAKIDGMVISNRRAKQLREKADSEAEVASKELQKRQMKMQLASLWSSTAVGIAGAWAQAFATNAPAWAPIVAGISTAALLANAGIQSSAINKNMESLATGGVIGGFNGASMGPDDRNAIVREGEMILNARQQRNLFKAITNDSVGGGGITVNIDKFTGGDDELSRLKDMLTVLKSNGQLAF